MFSFFSTRAAQEAHVIPEIFSSMVEEAVLGAGIGEEVDLGVGIVESAPLCGGLGAFGGVTSFVDGCDDVFVAGLVFGCGVVDLGMHAVVLV